MLHLLVLSIMQIIMLEMCAFLPVCEVGNENTVEMPEENKANNCGRLPCGKYESQRADGR